MNHPHIAQVFGLETVKAGGPEGQAAGRAIVMEFVAGRSLEAAIGTTGIPLGDALPLARQIADALEAAHERGIIHRDLKPANIMLTLDGQVKVLDFGLAKAADPSSSSGSVSESPTLTARATQMGMIIGTAAYMSPEQARGKSVDRRADVWAFGVVLYEMLTGQRAFAGPEITDVLAKVIERDADFDRLPPATPATIRTLLRRCLTKDPKQRLRDIGEARVTIDEVIAGRAGHDAPKVAGVAASRTRPSWLPWGIAGLLAVTSLYLIARPPATVSPPQSISAALSLPSDVEFYGNSVLSADGAVAAFIGVRQGVRQIYIRRLDTAEVVPVPGSETASVCGLSPDGSQVVFVNSFGLLMRMSIDGTASQQLATSADYTLSVTWGPDDRVIFAKDAVLWSVPAAGGEGRALTSLDAAQGEVRHHAPVVSTDAAFLFYQSLGGANGTEFKLKALELANGTVTVVADDNSQAVWASADQIVLARDSALFVGRLQNGRLEGTPVRLYDDVAQDQGGSASADVSDTGNLIAAIADVSLGRLFWVSMAGVDTPVAGPVREYTNPRLSPDGRIVLFNGRDGLWTLDIARGTLTKIASGLGFGVWIDSTRIAYRVNTGVVTMSADGTGGAVPLKGTQYNDYPASVSSDGALLATVRINQATSGDVYVFPLDGSGPARPFLATPAYEGGGQFSPDGKWMLFTSDENGAPEVYLTPFPAADRRIPVSSDGGLHPLWSGDGRRILYRAGQRMMAVDVTPGDEPRLSPPRVLFDRQYKFGPNLSLPHYSLGLDGQSLLMVKEEAGARSLSFISHWLQRPGR
jgi:hypothetical protein